MLSKEPFFLNNALTGTAKLSTELQSIQEDLDSELRLRSQVEEEARKVNDKFSNNYKYILMQPHNIVVENNRSRKFAKTSFDPF